MEGVKISWLQTGKYFLLNIPNYSKFPLTFLLILAYELIFNMPQEKYIKVRQNDKIIVLILFL